MRLVGVVDKVGRRGLMGMVRSISYLCRVVFKK